MISAIPLAAWAAAGYAVVGISPDSPRALANFARKQSLPFPLLSDPEHRVMEGWGAWGEKKNYGRTYTGVIRSTVVVGSDGTVRLARYNVRATGHVARLRKELGMTDSRPPPPPALRKHRRFQKR